MKNKLQINLISLVAVIFITALPAYCEQTTATNNTITKFLFAMGGVVISSLVIYVGLTIYNKFFVKKKSLNNPNNNIFSTPSNTDEAIVSFINRNRLG